MRSLTPPWALSLLVLAACGAGSVSPLLRESDHRFDTRLLGTWTDSAGEATAIISSADSVRYGIVFTDEDHKTGRFQAYAGHIGPHFVLDLLPEEPALEASALYTSLLLPLHGLVVLDSLGNDLRWQLLEPDSLKQYLQREPRIIAHSIVNDGVVLTAPTADIQRFLVRYLQRPGALTEPARWRLLPSAAAPGEEPCFEASAWREADLLFRRDHQWIGSDGAHSIDLGGQRTLWLFGDTWIDPSGQRTRRGGRMIRNSVAIQTGNDPSQSAIAFYWGSAADGSPGSFFPEQGDRWFWPGHGVRLGDRLVLFLSRVRGTHTGWGFESAGWSAVMVTNPDDQPSQWRITPLETPPNALGISVGAASVLRWREHVYAFGSQDPVKSHPLFVARWPVEQVQKGDLRAPEWWAGADLGWVPDSSSTARWPVFENGQADLTVHHDDVTGRFIAVQTVGFGAADVAVRSAPELTGPWTAPRMIYRPAEYYLPGIMIYSAIAHPGLAGADLVLTYSTNTFPSAEPLSDSLVYYPRFVRLARCR